MPTFRTTIILAAVVAMRTWVSAEPIKVARQLTSTVEFCTDAVYESGETCDNEAIPTYGTGSCAWLDLEPGICYNWSSFPDDDVAPLVNNLTFVYLPCCTQTISSCDLYTSTDCTGDKGYAGLGETGLDCEQPTINDKVNSFYCVSN